MRGSKVDAEALMSRRGWLNGAGSPVWEIRSQSAYGERRFILLSQKSRKVFAGRRLSKDILRPES